MLKTPTTLMAGSSFQTPRTLAQLVRGYRWLANQEVLACTVVLGLTLGLRALLLPWLPVPQPGIHDEFSYLLAADTYAHRSQLKAAGHSSCNFWTSNYRSGSSGQTQQL